MKRLLLTIALMASMGTLSAQLPEKRLEEARYHYDRTVAEQKEAVLEARNEERRIVDIAR